MWFVIGAFCLYSLGIAFCIGEHRKRIAALEKALEKMADLDYDPREK